jgi:Tol biopolymer transport system component
MGIERGHILVTYYAPAWGPDTNGQEVVYFLKQVAFESASEQRTRIYFCSIKPDGSDRKEIARLWKDQPDQFLENYSTAATMEVNAPTRRAAIGVEQGQRSGIFVIGLNGDDFQSLWPKEWNADRPSTAGYPTWSPEGKWIAFQEHRFENGFYLYRTVKMHPDLTAYTPLTERNAENALPAWSPKGDQIAYVELKAEHLWFMRPDGTEKRDTNQWGRYPRWSPDGKYILHDSTNVIDPDSGKVVRTFRPALPLYPMWGNAGFVFVGPDQIGLTLPDGKTTRALLRNVARRGSLGDLGKEAFRW